MIERLSIAIFILGLMANVFVAWMEASAHASEPTVDYHRMSCRVVSRSLQITRCENAEMVCYRLPGGISECRWTGEHA